MLYFPPHVITASALCEERRNPETAVCHLNAACCFATNTQTPLKYHFVTTEPPFTVKMIDCMHQTGPRRGAYHPIVCYPHAWCLPNRSQCRSLTLSAKKGIVNQARSERKWTVLLGCLTISTNVRCYQTCRWWQFCFPARQCSGALNTVQLLQCKTLNLASNWLKSGNAVIQHVIEKRCDFCASAFNR